MIITEIQALGREIVVEYSAGASWRSWGIIKEGEWDTHVFLGKVSLVHTNHWQRQPHMFTKLAGYVIAALGCTVTANALGFNIEMWGATGPQ